MTADGLWRGRRLPVVGGSAPPEPDHPAPTAVRMAGEVHLTGSLGGHVPSAASPDSPSPYTRTSLPARPADPRLGFTPTPQAQRLLARDGLEKKG